MKYLFSLSAIMFYFLSSFAQSKTSYQNLFDAKTFKGWQGDTIHTWRIEHGSLVGGSLTEKVAHNEFLATTRSYDNFDLMLKFKLTGTGFVNAGVQFRSIRLQSPDYEMSGYQADLGEGYWGSLYDESRRNTTLVKPDSAVILKILKLNDWNDYRIQCEGKRIRIWLNGTKTVDYIEKDEKIQQKGLIAVQIHGGGKAEAVYKDIKLKELP